MNNKYEIGETIIHRREGLTFIDSIVTISDKEYFLVRTRKECSETFYVPIDRADDIVRKVMDVSKADEILKYMKSVSNDYYAITKQRRDAYKKKLSSGETLDFAYLTVQLFYYNDLLGSENEIHLGPVDFDLLNKAESILFDELSLSYNVNRDSIEQFVRNRIKKLK